MNTRAAPAGKPSRAGVKSSVSQTPDSSEHAHSPLHSIFFLHRAVGNQALGKLISSGVIQHVSRKISVLDFNTLIPNPGGTGINQTRQDAIFDYVNTLCPETDYMATGGSISLLDDSFCVPSVLTADALHSKAELSSTPTSCTCLCDTLLAPDDIKINVDDLAPPDTRFENGGGTIRIPSPNNKNIPKVQGASGKMVDSPPFIVFGHELCGHYWLNMHGVDEGRISRCWPWVETATTPPLAEKT